MKEKEKVIVDKTEQEILDAVNDMEQMQLEVNSRIAKELDNVDSSINYSKLESDLNKIVQKNTVNVVALGVDELNEFQLNLTTTFSDKVSSEFNFTNTIMKQLQSELEQQNIGLVQSALESTRIYEQLYNSNFQTNITNLQINSSDLSLSQIQKQASEIAKTDMTNKFLVDDNITYYLRSNGAKERVQYYFDRNVRNSYVTQHVENVKDINIEIGNDLIRVSAHTDCSNLCAPYQGKILSQNGLTPNYTTLDEAISGGLFHWNCRHSVAPYVQGLSEPGLWNDERLPASERKDAYKERQKGKYFARQMTKYNDRSIRASSLSSEQATKYSNLAKYYKKQANNYGVYA